MIENISIFEFTFKNDVNVFLIDFISRLFNNEDQINNESQYSIFANIKI